MSYQRDAELTQQVLTEIKAERDQLREQNRVLVRTLEAIRDQTSEAFIRTQAFAALTATSQPTAAEVHQRMFDHGDATSQEGQG